MTGLGFGLGLIWRGTGGEPEPPTGEWILITGYWNNLGQWDDSAEWID
jgi:hypothetical protein